VLAMRTGLKEPVLDCSDRQHRLFTAVFQAGILSG